MEVMFDLVAGLDTGKGSVTCAYARPTRWSGQCDAHFQDDIRLAAGDAGLTGRDAGAS
jgi:hypothetical protein